MFLDNRVLGETKGHRWGYNHGGSLGEGDHCLDRKMNGPNSWDCFNKHGGLSDCGTDHHLMLLVHRRMVCRLPKRKTSPYVYMQIATCL